MKEIEILWKENGWTTVQDADEKKHILEISCRAENGTVVEVRKRHNDGEEEKLTGRLNDKFALPMSLEAFKTAVEKKELVW